MRKVEAKGNYETARRLRCTYGVSVNGTIRWRWFSPVDSKLHGEFLDTISKFAGSSAHWCLALRLHPDVYARSNSCGFCDICMLHVSRPARTALPSRCTKYKRVGTAYRPPSASARRHLRTSVPRGMLGSVIGPSFVFEELKGSAIDIQHDIVEGVYTVAEDFPHLIDASEAMKEITLSADERRVLAEASLVARYGRKAPSAPSRSSSRVVARTPRKASGCPTMSFRRI